MFIGKPLVFRCFNYSKVINARGKNRFQMVQRMERTHDNFAMLCTVEYIFRSFVQYYCVCSITALRASLKSQRKYHFPAENAVCHVRARAHFPWFSVPFFILNYPFDTNFGNPAVESSRTIYQDAFLVFSLFFFTVTRAIVRVAFFLRNARSKAK